MFGTLAKRLLNIVNQLIVLRMDFTEIASDSVKGGQIPTNIRSQIEPFARVCMNLSGDLGFERSVVTAQRLLEEANSGSFFELNARLQQLDEDIEYDVEQTCFEYVPARRARFYGASLGKDVEDAFPAATDEIREAHRCLALGRHTASVFHLVRAVEHGMRQLAIAVGVTQTIVPLEYQVWQAVIDQIESRYEAANIDRWRDPSKANARAFFSRTIRDLYAFKDETRNVLMHTRSGLYDEQRALSVRDAVAEFFERIRTKTQEGNRTLILEETRFA